MTFEAVHVLVRRAAERFPDRLAVTGPRGDLTYSGLEALSCHVADKLTGLGVRPGDFVPILAEDRREVIAAILGILKIGGVFVPVDIHGPRLQVGDILTDTAARHVIVGSVDHERSAELQRTGLPDVVIVPVDASRPTRDRGIVAHRVPSADDPGYVFYTSGTTGRPKGIVGRLGGIDHYVKWEVSQLRIYEGWRVSQLTSPAFDAVLRDVFVPLITGGTVCVPPAEARLDPHVLLRWLDDQEINLLHCIPSVFAGLTATASASDRELAALRCIVTAGERLRPGDVKRWFERYGERISLLNLYGPSETTMTKTCHVVGPADVQRPSIPIGRPIPGAEILILDDRQRPCAPGAVGEIHIRTAYRSLGYHNRPDATAAAFVTNPLTGDPGDLVYRTGDLGRELPDGALEYIGRRDHQVKIAGVRVELEGVEQVLLAHPRVAEASVAAVEGPDELLHLCAFVVLSESADAEELRSHLRSRLPEAMVPARLIRLDKLPRTISGKVDRRALSESASWWEPEPAATTEARTPTEEALVRLWVQLLPVQHVGVRQEFFDAGGHSLQVMRMLTRVQEHFGTEIPLRDFLASPTIESLARQVEEVLTAGQEPLDDLLEALGAAEGYSGEDQEDGMMGERSPA